MADVLTGDVKPYSLTRSLLNLCEADEMQALLPQEHKHKCTWLLERFTTTSGEAARSQKAAYFAGRWRTTPVGVFWAASCRRRLPLLIAELTTGHNRPAGAGAWARGAAWGRRRTPTNCVCIGIVMATNDVITPLSSALPCHISRWFLSVSAGYSRQLFFFRRTRYARVTTSDPTPFDAHSTAYHTSQEGHGDVTHQWPLTRQTSSPQ